MAHTTNKANEKVHFLTTRLKSKPLNLFETIPTKNLEFKAKSKSYNIPLIPISFISNVRKLKQKSFSQRNLSQITIENKNNYLKRSQANSPNQIFDLDPTSRLHLLLQSSHFKTNKKIKATTSTPSELIRFEIANENKSVTRKKSESLRNTFENKANSKSDKFSLKINSNIHDLPKGSITGRIYEKNPSSIDSKNYFKNRAIRHFRSQSEATEKSLDKGFKLYNHLYNLNFDENKEEDFSPPIISVQNHDFEDVKTKSNKRKFNVSFNLQGFSAPNKDAAALSRQHSNDSNNSNEVSLNSSRIDNDFLSDINRYLSKPNRRIPIKLKMEACSQPKAKDELKINEDINILDLSSISMIPAKQSPKNVTKIVIKDLPKSPFGRHATYNDFIEIANHFSHNILKQPKYNLK